MCCTLPVNLCDIFTMFFIISWVCSADAGAMIAYPPSPVLEIIAPVLARCPTRVWLNSVSNKHNTAKCEQCVLFLGWNVFVRHATEIIKTRPPWRLSGRHSTITELPARDTITSTNHSSNLVSTKPCPQDFCFHHTSGHEAYNQNSFTTTFIFFCHKWIISSQKYVHAATALLPLSVGNISDDQTFDIEPPMLTVYV